jgi:ParB family chromosome partitioning protein
MKGLGRGLSAILEDVEESYNKDLSSNKNLIKEIKIKHIEPNPFQPRKQFDEASLKELSLSIQTQGLLQPVLVIENDNNRYTLIAGERRLRATKMLKQKTIKAIVVDYELNKLREYAIIENIQREDLNILDLSISVKELLNEHNYTHQELADILSKSRSYITNLLRILNLNEYVKENLKKGKITFGHAKVMVNLSDDKQIEMCEKIIGENLSVREVENSIKSNKRKAVREYQYKNEIQKSVNDIKKSHHLNISSSNDYIKILIKSEQDLDKIKEIFKI